MNNPINSISALLESTPDAGQNATGEETILNMADVYIDDQVRLTYSDESIREMADSIIENDLLQAIEVRPRDERGHCVRFGHRRYLGNKLAGNNTIRAKIKSRDFNGDNHSAKEIIVRLVENIQRVDLAPFELAINFKRLKAQGLKNKQIGEKLGKKEGYVSKVLSLTNIPDSIAERLSAVCTDFDALYLFSQLWKLDVTVAVKVLEKGEKDGNITRAEVFSAKNKAEKEQGKNPKAAVNTDPSGDDKEGTENGDAGRQIDFVSTDPNVAGTQGEGEQEKKTPVEPKNEPIKPVSPLAVRFLVELEEGEKGYWLPEFFGDGLNAKIELKSGGVVECPLSELKIIKAMHE